MDDELIRQLLERISDDVTGLKAEVKEVKDLTTDLQIKIAEFGLKDLKLRQDDHDKRITSLESSRDRNKGVLIAMQFVWGIVAALITAYLISLIQ